MKNLATSMMAIGLVLFAASSAFFAYHFVTLGNSTTADAVIMITSGALACFAVFMRSRAIAAGECEMRLRFIGCRPGRE